MTTAPKELIVLLRNRSLLGVELCDVTIYDNDAHVPTQNADSEWSQNLKPIGASTEQLVSCQQLLFYLTIQDN